MVFAAFFLIVVVPYLDWESHCPSGLAVSHSLLSRVSASIVNYSGSAMTPPLNIHGRFEPRGLRKIFVLQKLAVHRMGTVYKP